MLWLNKMWNTYILVIPVRQHRHTYMYIAVPVTYCLVVVMISQHIPVCVPAGGVGDRMVSVLSQHTPVSVVVGERVGVRQPMECPPACGERDIWWERGRQRQKRRG